MNPNHKSLRGGLMSIFWNAGHAVWPVLTIYMAHTNVRNRAWPSLDALQKETGISRETVMDAKTWLVNHGALEPVPYAQRVAGERKHPRADVMQVTGEVSLGGKTWLYAEIANPDGDTDEIGQSSDRPTISLGQSSDSPTINRQTDRPEVTTTTSSDDLTPITAVWEQEAKAMLSPILGQELFDLQDTYTYSWVVDAIREAVITVGVGNFGTKYVESILKRWQTDGRKNETRDARAADFSWQYGS